MKRVVFFLLLILVQHYAVAQECNSPVLTNPLNGSVDVPVTTTISWDEVVGVPGYIISIGTTPGGTDIINQRNVGSALSYTPPLGLPENTEVFVTITLFFFDGGIPDIVCNSERFTTEDVTTPPPCTSLSFPQNGATNVNIGTNISWDYAPTATSYRLSIGTSPGGTDILNNQDVGNVLSYNPPVDFPITTQIYVTVTPMNGNLPDPNCTEESFETGGNASPPGCTNLIGAVVNGSINVPLTPRLEWVDVPEANGYRVTIGSSPFTAEVLDNVVFNTNETLVINFDPNRTFFVTIIPFNDAGDAIGCIQESFSTILGCGPYFDAVTGELVLINPEITLPDVISFCENESPFVISSSDTAEGFRWFQVDRFGNETLISDTADISLTEPGQYRYEAYNTVTQAGLGTIECPTTKLIEVVSSEIATITDVRITAEATGVRITVEAEGAGDYEYALNNINGPYQDSNVFNSISQGSYTVFVRDKNGCGIVQEDVVQDLTLEGFPKFFTPNGDGVNDYWQFIPPQGGGDLNLDMITIFDRYGKLLVQIAPDSRGWDGNYNGQPLPSTDYWFRAITTEKQSVEGHFSLKR